MTDDILLDNNCFENLSLLELEHKSKPLKMTTQNTPVYISLIKTTHICCVNQNVQKIRAGLCTAILGRPFDDGSGLSSKQRHIVPLWWVLLDSGSNGDLLF